jgi:hypothetical protein
MDPLIEIEECEPLMDYKVFNHITNIQGDNHLINITYSSQSDIAYITNTMDLANPLDMNLKMVFTDLHVNLKKDFPERTIFLEATTRGDNKIKKEMFIGVKKAC